MTCFKQWQNEVDYKTRNRSSPLLTACWRHCCLTVRHHATCRFQLPSRHFEHTVANWRIHVKDSGSCETTPDIWFTAVVIAISPARQSYHPSVCVVPSRKINYWRFIGGDNEGASHPPGMINFFVVTAGVELSSTSSCPSRLIKHSPYQ